jgi:UDP-N-acetylmuramate--alanine ligase
MYSHIQKIHFIGIGGIGMSGIAEVLLTLGYKVSGSDLKRSATTDRLKRRGAKVYYGHKKENVKDPDVVVFSSAIAKNNPERVAARHSNVPLVARAEMFAELMRLKYGVAVAGTHGKTTVTSLVAHVLTAGGLDPTCVVGGRVKSLRTNARLGKGEFLVAEADESDRSFLHLSPTIAVLTNIDEEHMEQYSDYNELKNTFRDFCLKVPFYGLAVFCVDHEAIVPLIEEFPKRFVTYGLKNKADYSAHSIQSKPLASTFELKVTGKAAGRWRLNLMGHHNIQNALAAIAVGSELGVPLSTMKKALSQFKGIGRRLEVLYKNNKHQIFILDDYGHHPVEIQATLQAVRKAWPKCRLIVVFQPHRFSRTKDLFKDFTQSFSLADHLIVTEIYAAGEVPIRGISAKNLSGKIKGKKLTVSYCETTQDIQEELKDLLMNNTVMVTLGAGDIWKIGKQMSKTMKRRALQ